MVQEKYDTWRLSCNCQKHRIGGEPLVAFLRLSSVSGTDSGNAVAVVLDSRHSRSPATAEFRAHLLLPVFGDGFLLWRVPTGAQRAVVLSGDSAGAGGVRLDGAVPWVVVSACAAAAFARRICADSRADSSGKLEAPVAGCGLRACPPAFAKTVRGAAPARWIQLSAAERRNRPVISSLARFCAHALSRLAMEIREVSPRCGTKIISPSTLF